MPRSSTVRRPTRREMRQLRERLESEELGARQRRRAEAIVLHAAGLQAGAIAEGLGAHRNTVATDLHAFARQGVACLAGLRTGGAPARIGGTQRAAILALAERPPSEVGLPYGRWSLATLRAELLARRVVRAISREHLRRVLQKGGSGSGASAASSRAPTRSGRRS